MNTIKAKCDAYRTMVKAEAKFIEAKENYYLIAKAAGSKKKESTVDSSIDKILDE